MASALDLPARHRHYAKRIPDGLTASLSPAELRHRVAYAAEIEDTADAARNREVFSVAMGKAGKILRSEPVWHHIQTQRKLSDLAGSTGGGVRMDVMRGRSEHASAHEYPPGLKEAVEGHYDGRANHYPHLAGIAAEIVAHHDR